MANPFAAAALAVALSIVMAMPAGAVSKRKNDVQGQQVAARTQTVTTTYGRRTCGHTPASRNPQVFLRQQARGCF
jgi:hypothetical protein